MHVKLLRHTPDPEQVVAMAGRLCYSAACLDDLEEKMTPEESARMIRMLVRMGRAARLMRADAAEACARTAAEVYSGGGGRFGADRAARGVFLSGAERDAV